MPLRHRANKVWQKKHPVCGFRVNTPPPYPLQSWSGHLYGPRPLHTGKKWIQFPISIFDVAWLERSLVVSGVFRIEPAGLVWVCFWELSIASVNWTVWMRLWFLFCFLGLKLSTFLFFCMQCFDNFIKKVYDNNKRRTQKLLNVKKCLTKLALLALKNLWVQVWLWNLARRGNVSNLLQVYP